MNPDFDRQSVPQTPEKFAEFLRMRVQEAMAASVHHASLSQQYMSLSQRFSALAEQAASGNASQAYQSLPQLEREANSGIPAGPVPGSHSAALEPSILSPGGIANAKSGVSENADPLPNRTSFFSPAARFAPAHVSTVPASDPSAVTTSSVANSKKEPSSAGALLPQLRKRKRRVSVRSVLDRARLVGLEAAEKVRVKVKQADLKPQLRSTTEELKVELKRGSIPAVISFVLTAVMLFILALRQMAFFEDVPLPPIISSISETIEPVDESIPIEIPAEETGEQLETPVEELAEEPAPEPEPEQISEPDPPIQTVSATVPETPDGTVPSAGEPSEGAESEPAENRSEAGRKTLLEKYGGTAASESAVGLALEWLAARQRVNGTWDFTDVGACTGSGSVNNPIGGTAYALLPFLAAGQTHKEGKYRKQVQTGLAFLTQVGIVTPAGYDLRGVINKVDKDTAPNYAYYVHGTATLALCEAYEMTKDRNLRKAAEGAVLFIVNSQSPRGGGWRYNPQDGGTTSATAVQVMALKAAERAGIRIPAATWKGVSYFLDSVSVDGKGRYGYEAEKKTYELSVTSMALLGRMSLGWGRDDGDMRAGIALLDRSTPTENYYTNYFATQVMKNWGGSEWDRWNVRVRDDLIARQETSGPERGSWATRDRADYSKSGGRLLSTCLATLTLEVYYRNKSLLEPEGSKAPLQENSALVAPPSSR